MRLYTQTLSRSSLSLPLSQSLAVSLSLSLFILPSPSLPPSLQSRGSFTPAPPPLLQHRTADDRDPGPPVACTWSARTDQLAAGRRSLALHQRPPHHSVWADTPCRCHESRHEGLPGPARTFALASRRCRKGWVAEKRWLMRTWMRRLLWRLRPRRRRQRQDVGPASFCFCRAEAEEF